MNEKQLHRIGKILNHLSIVFPWLVGNILFFFFTKPLKKIGFTKHRIQFLNKSNKQVLKIGQHRIAYYHWPGDGPNVLLLHGWESNSGRWKSLVDTLTQSSFNVFAFDAPAHGYSGGLRVTPIQFAEIADHFIKTKNIDHIVGHSFGGYTVIYYGHNYDHSLKSIVALAPTNSIRDVVNGMKKALNLNERTIQAFEKAFVKHYGSGPDDFDSAEFAKSISIPGLIIHDIGDEVLPIAGSQKIHNNWSQSEMIETEGLGHRLIRKDVDQSILHFLSKNIQTS